MKKTKQDTAIDKAIGEITNNIEHSQNLYTKRGLNIAKSILLKYLVTERTQIEEAYNQGCSDTDNKQDGNKPDFRNCIDYFDKSFGLNQKNVQFFTKYKEKLG